MYSVLLICLDTLVRGLVMKIVGILLFLLINAPPHSSVAAAQTSTPAATTAGTPTTSYTLPADKLVKAKALYDLEGKLLVFGTIYGFAILLAILYFGLAARYRDWAEKASKYLFVQVLIVVPLLLLTLSALHLPLSAYYHHISLQYGLSVQGWSSWFGDVLKIEAVTMLIYIPAVWILIRRIRKSPRWWWFHSWLIALPFIVFLVIITPVVIEPLFDKFEPLDKNNAQLVSAIEQVTQRGGLVIPRDRMYLMKASEKVTTLNAYVSGFGPSKRVVVWDTTIQKSGTPEILFVFGHEMGHYVLNHILIGMVLGAIGLLIGLYLLYRLSGWFLRRFGRRWHIRELGDLAVLPMFLLILSILTFIARPVESTISRQIEHNA